jgi:hypothetical protein
VKDRCSVAGAEKAAGTPGRRRRSRAGARAGSPAAPGCGRPGRLVLSARSASPPLALQPRCGPGRGATEQRGRGLLAGGDPQDLDHRKVGLGLSPSLLPPPLTLGDNLLSPPLPPTHSLHPTPTLCFSLFRLHLLKGMRGLMRASLLPKKEHQQGFHSPYLRASSTPIKILSPDKEHTFHFPLSQSSHTHRRPSHLSNAAACTPGCSVQVLF